MSPVYPSSQKELASVSELAEALRACEATKDCVVIDPADFGANPKLILLELDGMRRTAKPLGYTIVSGQTESSESLRVSCLLFPCGNGG